MGLRIATNVSSLTAQRHLINTRRLLDRSLERLSSGYRINKAGDDAAGLAQRLEEALLLLRREPVMPHARLGGFSTS